MTARTDHEFRNYTDDFPLAFMRAPWDTQFTERLIEHNFSDMRQQCEKVWGEVVAPLVRRFEWNNAYISDLYFEGAHNTADEPPYADHRMPYVEAELVWRSLADNSIVNDGNQYPSRLNICTVLQDNDLTFNAILFDIKSRYDDAMKDTSSATCLNPFGPPEAGGALITPMRWPPTLDNVRAAFAAFDVITWNSDKKLYTLLINTIFYVYHDFFPDMRLFKTRSGKPYLGTPWHPADATQPSVAMNMGLGKTAEDVYRTLKELYNNETRTRWDTLATETKLPDSIVSLIGQQADLKPSDVLSERNQNRHRYKDANAWAAKTRGLAAERKRNVERYKSLNRWAAKRRWGHDISDSQQPEGPSQPMSQQPPDQEDGKEAEDDDEDDIEKMITLMNRHRDRRGGAGAAPGAHDAEAV